MPSLHTFSKLFFFVFWQLSVFTNSLVWKFKQKNKTYWGLRYKATDRILVPLNNFSLSSLICRASSLVGTKTSAFGFRLYPSFISLAITSPILFLPFLERRDDFDVTDSVIVDSDNVRRKPFSALPIVAWARSSVADSMSAWLLTFFSKLKDQTFRYAVTKYITYQQSELESWVTFQCLSMT